MPPEAMARCSTTWACQLKKQNRLFDDIKGYGALSDKKNERSGELGIRYKKQTSQRKKNVELQVTQHRRIPTFLEEVSKRHRYGITTIIGLRDGGITQKEVLFDAKTHSIDLSVKPELITSIRKYFEQYEHRIKFERPTEIIKYFGENSDKIDELLNIIHKIIILKEKYFGGKAQSQLFLQVNHDPEINDQFLKFYIRQTHYETDFFEKLDKLQEDYFADLHKYDIWILVSSDFKKITNE